MANRIVPVNELKIKLSAVMAELEQEGTPLCITRYGKPKVVMARYDEYEALLRRIEDLEDILAMKESLAAPDSEAISLDMKGDREEWKATTEILGDKRMSRQISRSRKAWAAGNKKEFVSLNELEAKPDA